jgi:predicted enzyme related to lactoylglutathione lyase
MRDDAATGVTRREAVSMIAATAGVFMIPEPARAIEAGRIHPGGNVGAPIVYFEIAGPEAKALKSFYSAVFAWEIDANATIAASSTGGMRGGLRQDPPEKVLYLGVANIDQTLNHIEDAGGKTIVPRTVVLGVVTFALFSDPAGNRMGLAEFGSYK